jgi:predicted DNA-binding transcriptional regulator AlpA
MNGQAQNSSKKKISMTERLLTRTELAKWLNVSRQWLDAITAHADAPPSIHIGGRAIRYDPAAVRAWLATRLSCAPPPAAR